MGIANDWHNTFRERERIVMDNHLTVKELPESEKPYEKFLNYGPGALSDAELLAVIIKSGTSGLKSVDVAQNFLNLGNKNLMNLYQIPYRDMVSVKGIGKVKAIQLKCIAELSCRIASTRYYSSVCLNSASSIASYYMERMRHENQEQLVVCMFDSKCRLLDDPLITKGSVNCSFVPPREIFIKALEIRAVHLVLVHNHPSGRAVPSAEDNRATERILECGKLLGITLSDHIIIGDGTYYSYRESGVIA